MKPATSNFIFFLIIIFIIIATALLYLLYGGQREFHHPEEGLLQCEEGNTRPCMAGNCSGTSVCMGGLWTECSWKRICSSGSREMCIENNCVKGYRECNECGSGFGECIGSESCG